MSASVLLSINQEGKVLAVTRKGSSNDWGLPGGKREPMESFTHALYREVKEETGLDLIQPISIYSGECGSHHVQVYYARVTGQITPEENSKVAWVPWGEVLVGSFGEFNQRLYTHIYENHKGLLNEDRN